MSENEKEREVTYEMGEHLGVIASGKNGWSKELNLVSWNGNPQKYDIREWCENHSRMRKGITLTPEEMKNLYEILKDLKL